MRAPIARALIALWAATAAAGMSRAANPVGKLPPDVRATLDEQYRGWRFATLDAQFSGLLAAGDSPEWIKGDYDGDGKVDYAVHIVNEGSDGSQKVVILLSRAKGFVNKSFSVPTDAIDVIYEEKGGVTYLFKRDHFRRIVSGD